MNIYGYEHEEDLKPQLKKTGMLTAGIVFGLATLLLYIVLISYNILVDNGYRNPGTSTIISIILTICYIGTIVSFIGYLGNFKMSSTRSLAYAVLVLNVISLFMTIGNHFFIEVINNNPEMSFNTYAALMNIVYLIWGIMAWGIQFGFGGTMVATKADFVGGIRTLGGIYLGITVAQIFFYIFHIYILPSMINAGAFDSLWIYSIIPVISLMVNAVIIIAYLYVFFKARQYSSANR